MSQVRAALTEGSKANDSVIPVAAYDQDPLSAWVDGLELRVHAFADGAERTVVIPSAVGPGETAASICAGRAASCG